MLDLSPLMQQYHQIKKDYQDTILMIRIGDFYETFYEDAKIASSVLDIVLTSKPVGKNQRVPLAGIPHHTADSHINILTKAGYKVAICEQIEDAKLAKGIVKREVVRVITSGTILSDAILENKKNNFLIAINKEKENLFGLGIIDFSTGDFLITEIDSQDKLANEIIRLSPAECLLKESLFEDKEFITFLQNTYENIKIEKIEDWIFNLDYSKNLLKDHFKVNSLDGFGCENFSSGIGACGAILSYLKKTQKNSISHLTSLKPYFLENFMCLDKSTQINLELIKTFRDNEKKGSLLWVIDETITSMGGRKIRDWLLHPLLILTEIQMRQDAVQEFYNNTSLTSEIRTILGSVYDIERYIAKICSNAGNARDLLALGKSFSVIPKIIQKIKFLESSIYKTFFLETDFLEKLGNIILSAIFENPPLSLKEGGLIKFGFDPEIDELQKIIKNGKQWIVEFEAKEKQKTQINSLKVKFNNVFGYYIEITKPNLSLVPNDYIRKQTISTGERFITSELKDYENKIQNANEKLYKLEYEVFQNICNEVKKDSDKIQKIAHTLASIDVISSLSIVAHNNHYCKPQLTTEAILKIKDSRHPVLEKIFIEEKFVPNDIDMDIEQNQIMIITGPNMAGKSTYIRQIALIVLLAQIGSFVPAKNAIIGLVDRIFTRIGASDFLIKGQSTFMVEMNETSNILHNATSKSLIILDEIGRGTSTFDGISLAWAIAEYIHNKIKAKTLFATHYNELTELEILFPKIKNYNIAVKEWNEELIFLRKILKGSADKSYGIQVARLAGLPEEVITRAKEVMNNLENIEIDKNGSPNLAKSEFDEKEKILQLNLFAIQENQENKEKIIRELEKLDINNLTPIQAFNELQKIKEELKNI
ncbi:MAG: DNA mismatch repair protein MutS [bacterium]